MNFLCFNVVVLSLLLICFCGDFGEVGRESSSYNFKTETRELSSVVFVCLLILFIYFVKPC